LAASYHGYVFYDYYILRLTVNDGFYATYNFQCDPARFYQKPSLKRKQKTGFLRVFSRHRR